MEILPVDQYNHISVKISAFSALTLFVGHQQQHLVCKKIE